MTKVFVKDIDIDWGRMRKHSRDLDAAVRNIVTEGGYALLEAANETVPTEDEDLKNSGMVAVDERGEVTVGYTAPYALRQHERMDYRHHGSGRAKWLERTAQERDAQKRVGDAMAEGTREAMDG